MKILKLIIYIFFLILLSTDYYSYAQVLITSETFDEPDGSITGTMSNGEPWEANTYSNLDGTYYWGVLGGDFECNDVEGFGGCNCGGGGGPGTCGDNKNIINFGPINIAAFQGVSLIFSAEGTSNMECGSCTGTTCPCPTEPYSGCLGGNDQIVFYYSIDGAPYEIFEYYCGSTLCFHNNPQACNLHGSTLNIKLELGNQGVSEYYYIHELSVYGYTDPAANAIATPANVCEGEQVQLNETGGYATSWSWTGPGGFSSNQHSPVVSNPQTGDYIVNITDNHGCTIADTVQITVNPPPDASLAGNLDFCPGDCFDINTIIQGGQAPYEAHFTIQVGAFNFPFTVPTYDVNNQLQICYSGNSPLPSYSNNVLTIPTWFTGNTILTLTDLIGANGCHALNINPNQTSLNFKDKINANPVSIGPECDYDHDGTGVFDLSAYNNSTYTTTWCSDPACTNVISTPSNYSVAIGTTDVYFYLSGNPQDYCNSDIIPVTLTVVDVPDPGQDANTTACNNSSDCVNFWFLNSITDQTGTWSDVNGSGVDLSFPNCVQFDNPPIAPGTYNYVYTVQDPQGICSPQTSTLTVEVQLSANAGSDASDVFCGAPGTLIDLYSYIGSYDPGGIWTTSGPFNVSNGSAVDMSGAGIDTYEFYYELSGTCGNAQSTVTIQVISQPNAGNDNSLTICNSGSNTFLNFNNALGTHDNNGDWSGNAGGVNLSDPNSVNFEGITTGTYTFIYDIAPNGNCPEDFATITVTVLSGPNAGIDGTGSFCKGANNLIDLFSFIGSSYDIGGNWVQLSGNSINISNPSSVNISGAPTGNYTFAYIINGSCSNDTAKVNISIFQTFGAGDDYQLTLCQFSSFNLYDSLKNYIAGGIWKDEYFNIVSNPTSVTINNTGIDTFYYILYGVGGCTNDTSLAVINSISGVNAGTNNTFLICQGSTDNVNLQTYLSSGYTTGGTFWSVKNGIYTSSPPIINFSAYPLGIDTFAYIVNGSCGKDTALILANITTAPKAGDDYVKDICQFSSLNLFDNLKNYTNGGEWYDETGNKISAPYIYQFNMVKSYHFKYIIPKSGSCLPDTALVTVNALQKPEAGTGIDITVCEGYTPKIDLYTHLSGAYNSGGIWQNNIGNNISNPSSYNATGLIAGIYNLKYIVAANATCPGDTAYVKLTINSKPDPGADKSIDICNGNLNNSIDFETVIGNHDTDGHWVNNYSGTINFLNPKNVNFTNINPGTYKFYYKINSDGICSADSSIVTVIVKKKLSAGIDKSLTFCENATGKISLVSELSPDPNTSYKSIDVNNSTALNTTAHEVDLSKLKAGDYNYKLITGIGDLCGSDTSQLSVKITKRLVAGNNNTLTICNDNTSVNLDTLLGIHDTGGIWTDLNNSGVNIQTSKGKNVSFKDVNKGTYKYEYKQTATSSCPESSAIITIIVNTIFKTDYIADICNGQNIKINGHDYNSVNLTGTEVLQSKNGCDSIVQIKLTLKTLNVNSIALNENCFGKGSFVINNVSNSSLPVTLNIDGIGNYNITTFPFTVKDLTAGTYGYTMTDKNGCQVSGNNFVINQFTPFSINIDVKELEKSYLLTTTTSITPKDIQWTPVEGLSCGTCLITNATPLKDQSYVIEITDENGCTVRDTVDLRRIINVVINVPNVFTPDGDSHNERFYANCKECDFTYNLTIFDRWGEKIYKAEGMKFNDNTFGWDGRFKGQKLNPGVYVYVIEYIGKTGIKEVFAGDVLILK